MKRFPHYLRPCKGGSWPTHILCVYVRGERLALANRTESYTEEMRGWSVALLERRDGDYETVARSSGQSASGFWEVLLTASAKSGALWLFSCGALRHWNLLDLWGELERGEYTLREPTSKPDRWGDILPSLRTNNPSAKSVQTDRGDMRAVHGGRNGYLVLESPPAIARIRHRSCARFLQWVDLANYGVDCPATPDSSGGSLDNLVSTLRSIVSAVSAYNLGSLRATAASQALHGFRVSYYTGGIYVHNDKRAIEIETNGYYGGRCECARIGLARERLWHLDFRSLYPSVCRDIPLPIRLAAINTEERNADLFQRKLSVNSIAEVDLETDEPSYPYRREDDIIYPIGRFRTTLCGPELADATTLGRVRRIYRSATYEMDYTFRGYANALDAMRSQADEAGNAITSAYAKRLANSLPGKMGQRSFGWQYVPECTTDILYGEWYGLSVNGRMARFRAMAGLVFRLDDLGLGEEACPAIAAWICSAARMRLLNAIRCAGWSEVYYVDTDSLFTTEVGYERLTRAGMVANGTMGRLQEKGTDLQSEFSGIKHYTFGGRNVCAGVTGCADIGDNGITRFHIQDTPKEQVRRGAKPVQRSTILTQTRGAKYRHGTVSDSGKVSPIILREW